MTGDWHRPRLTSSDTQAKEQEWWQRYADLEDRFCWAQTPMLQRILRGHYLNEIISIASTSGSILELGCGSGWLAIALAEAGATNVLGIDFSAAQIGIARRNAQSSPARDAVHFICSDGCDAIAGSLYDCVVIHGFLHHLDQTEIQAVLRNAANLLKPNGNLILFEPVLSGSSPEAYQKTLSIVEKLQSLRKLANKGSRVRWIRSFGEEESGWRSLLATRPWGKSPHGPSPKEMPFEAGELEEYISPMFLLHKKTVCMALSHLVAQEWLLRELSHPASTRFLLPWVARMASTWDRELCSGTCGLSGMWLFTMFHCSRRNGE